MNVEKLTIASARRALDSKEISSVELTQTFLDRIKERNPKINAYITVTEEIALVEAKAADEAIAKGEQRRLTGIPYGVKDAICVRDVRSTGAATILDIYHPSHESTVISKIRAEGAVLLGKQNCDTFGHGASNENSMYGPVANPYDESRVAGGSSGGSAAAVADGQAIFSIAEDTGGSIRYPAGFCGIVGVRPSYGRNSRWGVMPMASSLDTVGPMAHTVEDTALLMEIMAGVDAKDATTVRDSVPSYTGEVGKGVQGLRIGIPKEYMELEGLDPEIRKITEASVDRLREAGATIVPISLPHTKYAIATYYIIVPSEDSSNLGRIDGIRYGVQKDSADLYDTYAESRSQGMPEEVKRRIMIGTYALSAGYYDAYYRKAQRVRTLIRRDFDEAFKSVDAIVTPTSPFPAFKLGEKKDDVLAMYLADVFMSPSALAGVPGVSVPAGMTKDGLPVGVQVIGPRMGEGMMLRVAQQISIL